MIILMSVKIKDYRTSVKKDSDCILTSREIEYLSLIALGYHNPQIAEILEVSYYTVKKTLELIFNKLNASDRASAVSIGYIHQILNVKVLTSIAVKYKIKTNQITLSKK